MFISVNFLFFSFDFLSHFPSFYRSFSSHVHNRFFMNSRKFNNCRFLYIFCFINIPSNCMFYVRITLNIEVCAGCAQLHVAYYLILYKI